MVITTRWLLTAALVGATPLALSADTLYLRNGRRIDGDLISVRGTTIEFQDRSGNVRTIRIDRREVSRIEFDEGGDYAGGSNGRWGIPGEYDHPTVREAYARTIAACRKQGKHCGVGGLATRPDLVADFVRMGARYVSTGTDLAFLLSACTARAKQVREIKL